MPYSLKPTQKMTTERVRWFIDQRDPRNAREAIKDYDNTLSMKDFATWLALWHEIHLLEDENA